MSRNDYLEIRSAYLAHTGVKGMKWRFHKYTNKILSGGRNLYQYAQRKATYYGGQARRELNKAKRVVRKGINSFGNNVSKSLSRAYHNVKARYNPGALIRRAKRSYDIHKLNQRTANINKAHKSQNAMANDARYRVNKRPDSQGRSYVGSVNGKAYYGVRPNNSSQSDYSKHYNYKRGKKSRW